MPTERRYILEIFVHVAITDSARQVGVRSTIEDTSDDDITIPITNEPDLLLVEQMAHSRNQMFVSVITDTIQKTACLVCYTRHFGFASGLVNIATTRQDTMPNNP